jgi:hypothetical protein
MSLHGVSNNGIVAGPGSCDTNAEGKEGGQITGKAIAGSIEADGFFHACFVGLDDPTSKLAVDCMVNDSLCHNSWLHFKRMDLVS